MTTRTFVPAGVRANPAMNFLGAPRVAFYPNEDGTPTEAEKAAAEKAAADKAAADKIAADKAAADKAAAEKLAEDAKKDAQTLAAEKAKLEAEKADLLKETMGRKDKIRELEDSLKRFDGIDLDAVNKLIQEKKDAEKADLEKKGEFARLTEMMKADFDSERTKLAEANKDLSDKLAQAAVTIDGLTIGSNFSGSKFIAEDLMLTPSKARQLYGSHFELEDGKVVGYDKPKGAADRTKLINSSAQPLAFDEAFRKIIDADPDKEMLLRSKVAPGAGSKNNSGLPAGEKQKSEDTGPRGASRIALGLSKMGA